MTKLHTIRLTERIGDRVNGYVMASLRKPEPDCYFELQVDEFPVIHLHALELRVLHSAVGALLDASGKP